MTTHLMFDGRLQLYRRPGGRVWQCAARVGGQRFRESTKEEGLDQAKDFAEEWYLDLRGKTRRGEIVKKERTFREAWELYIDDVRVLTIGTRSPKYVELMELRVKRHILPYFGDKAISEVNRGMVQAYRVKRAKETIEATAKPEKDGMPAQPGKPPARSTMNQEIVHIRQVLKHAEGLGWIASLPNLSMPYMSQTKKGRRAWFSPEEYKQLYTATAANVEKPSNRDWEDRPGDLHDFVLFQANTGLRPDETIGHLELRDVKIEFDPTTRKDILSIDVRGKVGVGYCKSMPGAVLPFKRAIERRRIVMEISAALDGEFKHLRDNALRAACRRMAADLKTGKRKFTVELPPTTKVFPNFDRDTFNRILAEQGLKFDRDGKPRTAISLRHTYISLRLLAGAEPYWVANNCRTSVQMIEDHYASHIKDRLITAAINVERPTPKRAKRSKATVQPEAAPAAPQEDERTAAFA